MRAGSLADACGHFPHAAWIVVPLFGTLGGMSDQEQPTTDPLDHKVIIMHGFSFEEINQVMKAVKQQFEAPRDLVFAKTTNTSLTMVLKDLIEDMCEDHEYLKRNPPAIPRGKPSPPAGGPDNAEESGEPN